MMAAIDTEDRYAITCRKPIDVKYWNLNGLGDTTHSLSLRVVGQRF